MLELKLFTNFSEVYNIQNLQNTLEVSHGDFHSIIKNLFGKILTLPGFKFEGSYTCPSGRQKISPASHWVSFTRVKSEPSVFFTLWYGVKFKLTLSIPFDKLIDDVRSIDDVINFLMRPLSENSSLALNYTPDAWRNWWIRLMWRVIAGLYHIFESWDFKGRGRC